MKRTTILLFTIACLLLSVHGLAQRVTLSYKQAPLETVFKDFERQTKLIFIYDRSLLRNTKKVFIDITNAPYLDALKEIFKDQPLDYEILQVNILVKPKPQTTSGLSLPADRAVITGRVVTPTGDPIAGATVVAAASARQTISDEKGYFLLNNILRQDSLVVTNISFETEVIKLQGKREVQVILKPEASELIEVIVSNGYQKNSVEKLTGAYVKINPELLNRRVSTNILDRLEGVTSGLLFNKNVQPGGNSNQSSISIRGRSTIFANPEPLIILDNFPYTGDVNNINPNDIESVTVLKDAAAASIWGAYAANGVIVITTKTGKYNQPIKLSFNTNVTVGAKPDLYYEPILGSSDYIDVEEFLFGLDHYNERETNPLRLALPPAVEILIKKREGELSPEAAKSMLDALRQQDFRRDQEQYFYRHSINQQYAISASGGGPHNQYYFSAGYDKNLSNQRGNQYERITLNANNTYAWLGRKLELNTGIIFSATQWQQANISLPTNYPYADLVDANGQALAIHYNVRQPYIDTAGGGRLLDWNYRPLDELRLADNKTQVTDYRINVGLKYQVLKGLSAKVLYQYNKGFSEQRNLHSEKSYFTRDLINQFTQIDSTTITTPVPYGDILDEADFNYQAHNVRGQIDYNRTWNQQHTFNAFAGAELRSFTNQQSFGRRYGYNPDRQTSMPVDYVTEFPLYQTASKLQKIPYINKSRTTTDRYISYFVNAAYTFKQRYTVSASARKDESNIFGVKTNQKGVPLWSVGMSWEVSKEDFYQASNWLPYLRLRLTNGYNGNVDRTVSAFTTAFIGGINNYGAVAGSIINPPNPALRWEKVYMMNIGVDFATLNKGITGSIEYYLRRAKDLIGNSPLDPTTGNPSFRGNTANMKGSGIDITLHTQNVNHKHFTWMSSFLFSHTRDEVTEYEAQQNSINYYYNADFFNPLKERPVHSVYSLKWMGLDPLNGDPQGLLNNTKSKDYSAILNSTDFRNLQYNGPANPVFFGSLRNTFGWKQWQLSGNILFKAGYYFRRPSINYDELFRGGRGHADFSKRWQKAGDELTTYIPSLQYPNNDQRDVFYKYSSILVEKGDHLRLQDIRISYDLNSNSLTRLPFRAIQVYVYADNIGILWKANKQHIDPDYISGYPAPRTIAAGIKVDFK